MRQRLLLLGVVLGLSACLKELPRPEKISEDPVEQGKFAAAWQALDDLRQAKAAGVDVTADCRTAQMLFVDALAQQRAPASKHVLAEISTICRFPAPAGTRAPRPLDPPDKK